MDATFMGLSGWGWLLILTLLVWGIAIFVVAMIEARRKPPGQAAAESSLNHQAE